jgi:hypothetical protein
VRRERKQVHAGLERWLRMRQYKHGDSTRTSWQQNAMGHMVMGRMIGKEEGVMPQGTMMAIWWEELNWEVRQWRAYRKRGFKMREAPLSQTIWLDNDTMWLTLLSGRPRSTLKGWRWLCCNEFQLHSQLVGWDRLLNVRGVGMMQK